MGCRQAAALQGPQLPGATLQLQGACGPAAPQGQHHLDAGGTRPHHTEGDGTVGVLILQKGQGWLQRFDGDAVGIAHPADGSDIQTEQPVGQGRPIDQLQLPVVQIDAADLRLHEGHAGAIAELAQVNGRGVTVVDASDQGRHHARIQGRTVAINQHNPPLGPHCRPHRPAFEQQRMAVAAAGQQQGPGGAHAWSR